ncbi:MAG TPA: DUF1772 domain-containing protein [Anseongella sp.]|nr:DUF1772 domain-containing protein [Anseongella sp.]
MSILLKVLLTLTLVLSGLITGLFYAYSCSVNPGLGRLADKDYIRAMQSINRAILNPVFMVSFLGTLVMLPLSCWVWYSDHGPTGEFYLLLAAAVIYAFGVGVTGLGNVPLNESLDKFSLDTASPEEIRARRKGFELPWNRFHLIRTLSCLAALILVLWAVI